MNLRRYWHHPESGSWFATHGWPGITVFTECSEYKWKDIPEAERKHFEDTFVTEGSASAGRVPVGTDVQIYVPSRSRFKASHTLESISEHSTHRARLVVPSEQLKDYKRLAEKHNAILIPCPAKGIAATRHFIGKIAGRKFVMMDDDLRFFQRGGPGDWHLSKLSKHGMNAMMILLSRLLDHYAHVAVSAREGNNRLEGYPWIETSRPLRVLAYRKAPFMQCEHGRVDIMEDFDVTLQLMRMGYANAIISEYAQDQVMTQMPGGCSDYRTHEVHAASVRKLEKLHPGFVKLRQKENKGGGEFGSRTEATISWKKAYESGLEQYLGDV